MADFPVELFRVEGDPSAVRGSASRWSSFGQECSSSAALVRGLDSSGFIGEEGDLYREKLQESLPPHMEVTGAAYSKVGSALAAFAGDLDGVQDRMSPLAIRARNAWEALSAASAADSRAQLQAAMMGEIASRAPAGDAAAGVMSTSAADDAARTSGALSAVQSEWDQLVAEAKRVRDDAREAADRCARIINGAADGKFQENPTGWSGFVGDVQSFIVDHADGLRQISSALKIVSFVAGVLSFVPVLNFVAGPIALAAGAAALGIDVALKLATGEGSWTGIAVDGALIALPFVGSGARAIAGSCRATRAESGAVKFANAGEGVADDAAALKATGGLESTDWPKLSGTLRDATTGKGNYGLGTVNSGRAEALGLAWVGRHFRIASDGKTLISSDGLRAYRPPSFKPRLGRVQANLERWESGQVTRRPMANGHLDVVEVGR